MTLSENTSTTTTPLTTGSTPAMSDAQLWRLWWEKRAKQQQQLSERWRVFEQQQHEAYLQREARYRQAFVSDYASPAEGN